jgi:hypothetical protein
MTWTWTPVGEGLPQHTWCVLATFLSDEGDWWVDKAMMRDGQWKYPDGRPLSPHVVIMAWAPWPEPWRGKG